ncbi:hypothetical protein [Paraburkholderia fungorum]|uniref:Uncharacterized protein n=1 Tax=Paraburkholderia fungorum TaxID=134537 RepID=A0AAW3USB2_9BURK|nr:hypothetical protein [Paraburkholderia fungorum]MBB4519750.1 hypothetical protein [Paraburkholderia fungorum]MBB6201221.1 hypothetical protein [Paraburkholderia fungorum]
MNYPTVPDDFPREIAHGSIGGYQPKLLLRRAEDHLVSGPTEEELFTRYDACEDLARQLASYVGRKRTERGLRSLSDTLSRLETDVTQKVSLGQWDISSAEIAWIMGRVGALLVAETAE